MSQIFVLLLLPDNERATHVSVKLGTPMKDFFSPFNRAFDCYRGSLHGSHDTLRRNKATGAMHLGDLKKATRLVHSHTKAD